MNYLWQVWYTGKTHRLFTTAHKGSEYKTAMLVNQSMLSENLRLIALLTYLKDEHQRSNYFRMVTSQ